MHLVDSQPLEVAGRSPNLNGIPIYENSLVLAGITSSSSSVLFSGWGYLFGYFLDRMLDN